MENSNDINWAFPDVNPGTRPFGGRVLVQLRRVKRTTASGIVLAGETREFEKYNNQVGKVVALGALAFKKKDTLEPWPEGTWAEIGDFIRVPKYGGDRFEVAIPGEPEEPALFMYINDHELIGSIEGDPLSCQHEYVNR
jgi:co-chaperonin GroES (HSP10)